MEKKLEDAVLDALVSNGHLERDKAQRLTATARARCRSLLEFLLHENIVPEEVVFRFVAQFCELPYRPLGIADIEQKAVKMMPFSLVEKYALMPVSVRDNSLLVAVSNPLPRDVIANIQRMVGKHLNFCITPPSAIQIAFEHHYPAAQTKASPDIELAEDTAVSILERLLVTSFGERASDVHIESAEDCVRIRMRVDGILREVNNLPRDVMNPLISRIKVLAGLDIAEKRAPQDGSFSFDGAKEPLDIRVSVLPNIHGEKAVLRLLPSTRKTIALEKLGMEPGLLERFLPFIERPHGIVLVVGPTGSGKSTTLYAVLSRIRWSGINITTVEDPVESQIEGTTQVQVDSAGKVAFSRALRAILRQDPDVVMVGEIRDRETADLALRAALTGHLVLSTLHTNKAAAAVTRLLDMGCEPYIVASSITAVLAQRLVRVICPNCKKPFPPEEAGRFRSLLPASQGNMSLYRGEGCDYCRGTGYRGRIGIFELLAADDMVREKIITCAPTEEIHSLCVANGMRTLRQDGFAKVAGGITTPEEVLRVTASD